MTIAATLCRTFALALVAAGLALPAAAQPVREPKLNLLDLSAVNLIDSDAAKQIVLDNIPERVWKLFPSERWTYLSQVEGGFTSGGICVVTARVVMLPRTGTVRVAMWRPEKAATVFDAKPGLSNDDCRALAREKLKTAVQSVVSSLVK